MVVVVLLLVVVVVDGLREWRRGGRAAEGKMLGRRDGRWEKFLLGLFSLCW